MGSFCALHYGNQYLNRSTFKYLFFFSQCYYYYVRMLKRTFRKEQQIPLFNVCSLHVFLMSVLYMSSVVQSRTLNVCMSILSILYVCTVYVYTVYTVYVYTVYVYTVYTVYVYTV